MHRFYHHQTTYINKEDNLYKRLIHILRIKHNEYISLFFDHTEYIYTIKAIDKNGIHLKFEYTKQYNDQIPIINIYQSLIKKDKFEKMLNLATQTGVNNIYYIHTQYSQKIAFTDKNIDRLKKILIESTEQSGRIKIPDILNGKNILNATINHNHLNIILHNKNDDYIKYNLPVFDIHNINPIKNNNSHVNIFVGPEAGFGDQDILFFLKNNCIFWNMKTYILRAENAGAIACAILKNIM